MIMEIGLKFKYIVLVQDNVYIFKVYFTYQNFFILKLPLCMC